MTTLSSVRVRPGALEHRQHFHATEKQFRTRSRMTVRTIYIKVKSLLLTPLCQTRNNVLVESSEGRAK